MYWKREHDTTVPTQWDVVLLFSIEQLLSSMAQDGVLENLILIYRNNTVIQLVLLCFLLSFTTAAVCSMYENKNLILNKIKYYE